MNIKEILLPKSFEAIRKEVPCKYTAARIEDAYFDLNTGEKYQMSEYSSIGKTLDVCWKIFEKIISAYQNNDEIILYHQVFYGEYRFEDFIIFTELFTNVQKWDLMFSQCFFDGDGRDGSIELLNKTKKEAYALVESRKYIRENLLSHVKNLELVQLHLEFEALGGIHETTSRFTGLVQRANWNNGIKMISAIIESIKKLRSNKILINDNFITRVSDRILTDYYEIIYQFSTVSGEIELAVKHKILEDVTSVGVFKNGTQIGNPFIFGWFKE